MAIIEAKRKEITGNSIKIPMNGMMKMLEGILVNLTN